MLRHGAHKAGLGNCLTPDGFVPLRRVLALPRFDGVTFERVQALVAADAKGRFELKGGSEAATDGGEGTYPLLAVGVGILFTTAQEIGSGTDITIVEQSPLICIGTHMYRICVWCWCLHQYTCLPTFITSIYQKSPSKPVVHRVGAHPAHWRREHLTRTGYDHDSRVPGTHLDAWSRRRSHADASHVRIRGRRRGRCRRCGCWRGGGDRRGGARHDHGGVGFDSRARTLSNEATARSPRAGAPRGGEFTHYVFSLSVVLSTLLVHLCICISLSTRHPPVPNQIK